MATISGEKFVNNINVWQYYEELPKWKAKCKFCPNEYLYVDIYNLKRHIQKCHEEIFKHEIIRQEWPWIYFKCMYNDTSVRICLICNVNILSNIETMERHLRNHSKKEMEDYEFLNWVWKYFIKTDHRLVVRCDLCPTYSTYFISLQKTLNKHMVKEHSNILGITQETHDRVASSHDVQNLRNIKIHIEENIWKYYNKLSHFKIICKFCNFHYTYLGFGNLYCHIEEAHRKIFDFERAHERKNERLYEYFKYSFDYNHEIHILYSKCLICDEFFLSDSESTMQNHLDNHPKEVLDNFPISHWLIKYVTQGDDIHDIKCNICCQETFKPSFFIISDHTVTTHFRNLQLNSTQLKHMRKLWQKNIKINNFQIKCVLCNIFQLYHVNTAKFREHVKQIHKEVFRYEEEHEDDPFVYFKYLYIHSGFLQCFLCNAWCSPDYDSLTHHLVSIHNLNFFTKPEHYDWIWKYCEKSDDSFMVQCCCDDSLCNEKISLDVPPGVLLEFYYHILTNHSAHALDPINNASTSGSQQTEENRLQFIQSDIGSDDNIQVA